MPIKRGLTVVGRAEQMGLGSMTEDFCYAMQPEKVIIIDRMNGRKIDTSRIENVWVVPEPQWKSNEQCKDLLLGSKVVVGFESFYNDSINRIVNGWGGFTVMFPMWEWSPDYCNKCNLLICLSDTDYIHYTDLQSRCIRYDWPASPLVHKSDRHLNWPPTRFVHAAGNASHNRDGTQQVLSAASYLKGTQAKLYVYSAFDMANAGFTYSSESPIEFMGSVASRAELYDAIDVLVCPRRLPGHSLPINEATGEGIPVIVQDLTDWHSYPYKVPAHPGEPMRFVRGTPKSCWTANVDELGQLMLDMATGKAHQWDSPKVPTWDEFEENWNAVMKVLQ